jgi:hypothetical protein
MKSQNKPTTAKVSWLLLCALGLTLSLSSPAQVVIGSWQDNDGDGWIDWGNQSSITAPANVGKYSFVNGAVSGYAQSLQISQAGYNQNLAIKLHELPGGVAAFLTNHLLTFTFSVPPSSASGATAGFSQLFALSVNATGYGFVDQSFANLTSSGATNDNQANQPNFYFDAVSPARSQVVTLNYSNILAGIAATPENGYIELIFTFNNGGGAPTNYFINNVVLSGASVPPPPPPPPSTNTVIGSWQDNDGDGWIDWGNQFSITNAANVGKYSFVSGAVTGYPQSLQIGHSGVSQCLAIKLQELPGGVAAFLTNHLLSFTYSVPAAAASGATAGYSQLFELAINATGYGFTSQSFANLTASGVTNDNQGNQPNFYFDSTSPVRSQVVTLNYSNILSAIAATPENGYIELIFSFNTGGGAPTNYFINNVVLSGAFESATNPPTGPLEFTFSLLSGPTGAAINATNGVFTWRPLVSQANTTNLVTVKVTDDSAPPQSATNSFNVIVNPLVPAVIGSFAVNGAQATLTVDGTQGPDYTVLFSTNLVNWQALFTTNSPVVPLTLTIPVAATNPAAFYRTQMVP